MLTPINLQLGWPSPYLFPASSILKGASAVLTDSSKIASGLIYGPDEGYVPLRKSIAEWLSSTYTHSPASPDHERICITNGASGNLANVLQKFTDPEYTRIVWMVEPSYFLACPIFHDAGFEGKLRGVPEDEEGLDIAFLRSSLQAVEKKVAQGASEDVPLLKAGAGYVKLYKHVIYIVPTFSNPSAKTLSLRRREELVRLAREFDALVVTDDVYDVLRWPEDPNAPVGQLGKPPPRIVDVDSTLDGGPADQWGNTVSNGSFSKIIAPGCRVGWAEGTPAFTKQLSQV
jgi:DNA-binding transcriptional MocR family regulator